MELENFGFSLKELKAAGLTKLDVKVKKIPLDSRRKSCKDENIELLKNFESAAPAAKKAKTTGKASKVASLDELDGMTDKIKEKLADLGIDTPAKLLGEDVKELSKLLKTTQKQVKAWVDQISG